MGLNHDAVMRIGDDAPGDGPILWDGVEAMPASGHHHLGSLGVPCREMTTGRRRSAQRLSFQENRQGEGGRSEL